MCAGACDVLCACASLPGLSTGMGLALCMLWDQEPRGPCSKRSCEGTVLPCSITRLLAQPPCEGKHLNFDHMTDVTISLKKRVRCL